MFNFGIMNIFPESLFSVYMPPVSPPPQMNSLWPSSLPLLSASSVLPWFPPIPPFYPASFNPIHCHFPKLPFIPSWLCSILIWHLEEYCHFQYHPGKNWLNSEEKNPPKLLSFNLMHFKNVLQLANKYGKKISGLWRHVLDMGRKAEFGTLRPACSSLYGTGLGPWRAGRSLGPCHQWQR